MTPLLHDVLHLEGIAPHRALDRLVRRGVRVYAAVRTGVAAVNFRVKCKDTEKVFAIFGGSCYTVTKVGTSRGARLLAAVRRRPVFVGGALLIVLLSVWADGLVLRIAVSGSAARYPERARQVLAEAGVGVFSFYEEAAAQAAGAALMEEFDDVAFAQVQKSGCVVYVTLEEGAVAAPPVRKTELVAPAAGVVEELTVLRGVALAAEGQTVAAGDVLAAGRLAASDGSQTETFVSARCVLRTEYRCAVPGTDAEAARRAAAQARLQAERELHKGDVAQLTVVAEELARDGGETVARLTLRLVLSANY